MPTTQPAAWPVLKIYDQDHLPRIALPVGGIGTGTISVGGRGNLQDFEMGNNPAKGFRPGTCLFAMWAKEGDKQPVTKLLEGPLPDDVLQGWSGCAEPNHGWPRFRRAEFHAAYPLGQVLLSDPHSPVDVRLETFNPMIPGDADASGIPIVVLRYVLKNKSESQVSASVCGAMENFICVGLHNGKPKLNVNEIRNGGGSPFKGIFMRSPNVDPKEYQWGTFALAALKAQGEISYRTNWAQLPWGDSLLDFWDDFSHDGKLDERHAERVDHPTGALAVSTEIPAGEERAITFVLTWHFPNRLGWGLPKAQEPVGNYYTTKYWDAWDVIEKTSPQLAELEEQTVKFVRAFVESHVPEAVKDAALSNASTLRTQTVFRTADGRFYGWEGCGDNSGSCEGSCTHVWNYEQTTAHLYGTLAKSSREVEFAHGTNDAGLMSFRIDLPLSHAQDHNVAAADGQMGTIMRLYRDYRLSGDEAMLKDLWPHAKRALEFAWIPGGWDANKDGVMEGCQHNTMDVEYFGPNPEMSGWYLGALRAAEEMARRVGDDAFASTCQDLFERGRKWIDENLFNGEYYEQHIQPAADPAAIAKGLSHQFGGQNGADPVLQLGPGCLADQLVGQHMASVAGLGDLLDPAHMKTALASVMKYNFREDFFDHFNNMRTYATGDDSGLLIATYPHGHRPKQPFPYAMEVWTGIEYTAAANMIYEGLVDEGVKVVTAARDRHDGRKRNPFDEPECGHHYARAMAAWGTFLGITGFQFSALEQSLSFAKMDQAGTWFWSNGYTWGTVEQTLQAPPKPTDSNPWASKPIKARLTVMGAPLTLKRFEIVSAGAFNSDEPFTINTGQTREFKLKS